MKKKQDQTEIDFDLASLREIKRLLTRSLKKLVLFEKATKRRREDQREAWREKKRVKRERTNEELHADTVARA